jgi:hypothetical protein
MTAVVRPSVRREKLNRPVGVLVAAVTLEDKVDTMVAPPRGRLNTIERPVFVPPFGVRFNLESLSLLLLVILVPEKAGFSGDRKEVAGAAKAATACELRREKAAVIVTTAVYWYLILIAYQIDMQIDKYGTQ